MHPALAQAILRFMTDPESNETVIKNGLEQVKNEYDVKDTTRALLDKISQTSRS